MLLETDPLDPFVSSAENAIETIDVVYNKEG